MRSFVIFWVLLFTVLFLPNAHTQTYLSGLEKVDHVTIIGYYQDKVIKVMPRYIKKSEDKPVIWGGAVPCDCTTYVYDFKTREKGQWIKKTSHLLRRSDQSFYIDLKGEQTYDTAWVCVECVFTVPGQHVTASEIYKIR